MKVLLQTFGTRGDILPFIFLGEGLLRNGHDASLIVTSTDGADYSSLCHQLNLPVSHVPAHGILLTPTQRKSVYQSSNPISGLKRALDDAIAPVAEQLFTYSATRFSAADAVISHATLYPARAAALASGTAHITVTLNPLEVPGIGPTVEISDILGRFADFLTWKTRQIAVDLFAKRTVSTIWAQAGLSSPGHVVPKMFLSDILNLIPVGCILWKSKSLSSPVHRVTGALLPSLSDSDPELPYRMEDFFRTGPPPVFMTFGSMQRLHPEEMLLLSCEAAKQGKFRAIVQTSPDTGFPHAVSDGDVFYVHQVNYSRIFPRCSGIVSHGGVGTVNEALRAGIPSLVVAFNYEQYAWGQKLAEYGAGCSPLRYRGLTAENLASRVTELISSRLLARRSKELARRARADNGVKKAVQYVEEALSRI